MITKTKITEEDKKVLESVYFAAEMFWRDRMAGTMAVEHLQRLAKLLGIDYKPRESEREEIR